MVVGRPKQIFIVAHREIGRVDLRDDLRQHVALLPDQRVGDSLLLLIYLVSQ